MSFTSNKFAVLQVQNPKQPKPKGDKEVNSIPGPKPVAVKVESNNVSNQAPRNQNADNGNVVSNNRGRGGEYRGRGGNRGNRGDRGGRGRGGSTVSGHHERNLQDKLRDPDQPPKRNKRIYDRNSNVPKNQAKKSNFGTGNWGNEKEDPKGAEDAKKEISENAPASEPQQAAEVKEEGQAPNVVEATPEPEDKTITLKEFQEQQAALAPKFEAPKRRAAGEGEKSDLHKYTVLKVSEEDENPINLKLKEKKEKKKAQPKKQQTITIDVNVNSGDDRRGQRRGPNNYNNKKQQKKVNLAIEDTDSFPALK